MRESVYAILMVIIIGILGYTMYANSEKIVTNEFIVTEMNKENKELVYLENGDHRTHQVTAEEFLKIEVGDKYQQKEYSWTFIFAGFALIILIVIGVAILSNGAIDLTDLLEAFF